MTAATVHNEASEFVYRLRWRPWGLRPGGHVGQRAGMGHLFLGYASLLDHPDPRRLDLRASLRDPFGTLFTRTFRQRSAITVMVVADLSSSMRFGDKATFLRGFVDATARSAAACGDAFGFLGTGDRLEDALHLPPSFRRGAAQRLKGLLDNGPPLGETAQSLEAAGARLPRHRSLVLLVSDFHWPEDRLERVLQGLSRHDVVPVVVWHTREYTELPRYGLVGLQDPESGHRRMLFMRPGLAERLRASYQRRRQILTRVFTRFGRRPFFSGERFDPDALTDYFLGTP
ncbi:DUF58 domain-containing protein [Thiohalorhabdus methylotrophus]|uniref:DUF58 domain-containing protein n=1 Tax=Thiohalorhabdus methylotrophus TaxID=3242694 RepID=A0ABV4TY52_9GAMM